MVRKGGSSRSRMQRFAQKKAKKGERAANAARERWHGSSGMNRWQELYDLIQRSNVIVEVVDARDIDGTRVLTAERWADRKSLLIVANKKDLLHKDAQLPRGVIAFSAKSQDPHERRRLHDAILTMTEVRPVRALFIGYPNIGKSSLINMLAHRHVARVSPVAGTTKSEQWVVISPQLSVTDYRGVYPETEAKADLVRKGALNVQSDAEAYAHGITVRVLKSPRLREWLEQKFDIALSGAVSSEDVLSRIARRRGWFLKGGELNLAEAARSLVRAMREAPEI
jgi:ribosome biogenesis GTPase A